MLVAIHQPQFLPWLGYFDKIRQSDVFILLDNVQFKKNEWQNRNRIRTDQGAQWLTVPVKHNFGQNINEVIINNNMDWRRRHLKAIEQHYRKSPHFDKYFMLFEELYAKEWISLEELNSFIILEIVKILEIDTKIVKSSEIKTTGKSTDRLIELCEYFKASSYLSGIDGKKYMDFDQFKRHNIKVVTQDYQHPVYNQLYTRSDEEFVSHLSILDLLFNCGQRSFEVLNTKDSCKIE
jgi:hypothetical protein